MHTRRLRNWLFICPMLVSIFGLPSCSRSQIEEIIVPPTVPPQFAATPKPEVSPSPTITATNQPTRTSTPKSAQPSAIPSSPSQACTQPELDAYLAQIDPLSAEQLQESKQAEHITDLTQSQKETYLQGAIIRNTAYLAIVPPECLETAHTELLKSSSLLIQVWELGLKNDIAASNQALKDSYNSLVNFIALSAGY